MWLRVVELVARVRTLFARRRQERELEWEIESHLEQLTAENLRRGMTRAEGRTAARARFGNRTNLKEALRDQTGFPWLDSIGQDLRHAVRTYLRRPGFAAVAVLTLALGIGPNTALFSVVNAVILDPLPYREPSRLVWIEQSDSADPDSPQTRGPVVRAWREQARTISVSAFRVRSVVAANDGDPERIVAADVTPDFFALLDEPLAHGRPFTHDETAQGAALVIISHGAWIRRFGGDPAVLGTDVRLSGTLHAIVGVAPESFRFPDVVQPEFFLPLVDVFFSDDRVILVSVVGRLQASATGTAAEQELLAIQRTVPTPLRQTPTAQIAITPLHEELVGDLGRQLLLLFGVVSLVLLVACANLANLLLARGRSRRDELMVRAALGAGHRRLTRMLVVEGVAVALTGAAVGVVLAAITLRALRTFLPEGVAYWSSLGIDGTVVGFAAGLAVLVGLACGVLTGLSLTRQLGSPANRSPGRFTTASSEPRVRNALLVAQVALTFVLVVGAGLLLQSVWRLTTTDAGFDRDGLLTFRMGRRVERAANVQFVADLQDRLTLLPGVVSVGAASSRPLGGHIMGATEVWVEGEPPLGVSDAERVPRMYGQWDRLPDVAMPIDVVTPGYFRTVGTRLLRGRDFSRTDDANTPPVAIVNEAFTRRFRQGQVVVGRTLRYIDQDATIVGIVADVPDTSLRDPPEPTIFRPYSQTAVGPVGFLGIAVMVRTDNEHAPGLFDLIRREIRAIDRVHPIDGLTSMVAVVDASLAAERQTAILLTLFGGLALALAMIGTYGVSSYGVAQRAHEIGIRLALGSSRAGIWRLVAGPVFVATVAGIGLGLLSALGLTRFLGTLLFGVSAMDVATFVTTALVIATASIGAVYLPARRAARVDPMMALRAD